MASSNPGLPTPSDSEISRALSSTFQSLHNDVCKEDKDDSMGGSTACLVIVERSRVICANVGDSRAILVQAGRVKTLSDDHKPEREDERQRIASEGGVMVFTHSEHRVAGVLTMSKAIGDGWMAKYGVSCEPETTFHQRSSEDEYVIVASDGVWGAISNEEAGMIINRVMMRLKEKGVGRESSLKIAARFLVQAALNRGSRDNVSAIIISLSNDTPSLISTSAPLLTRSEPAKAAGQSTLITSRGPAFSPFKTLDCTSCSDQPINLTA